MPEATPPQASESDIGVLLVDDSKVIRLSLAAMLGGRYRVREARNGRDAIAQYHLEKPDIMILDVNMPELDGFGVVDYVRNEVHDQETFILILTAEDDRTVRPRILSLGANDFLAKPCERVELLARTQVAARQMRLTRSLKASLNALAGELHTVGRLQRIMLPQASPFLKGLAVDSLYRPSGHASGDYFDYFPVGEDVLRLVVADVSGHGARAACLMAIVRTIFHVSKTLRMELAATMELLNDQFLEILAAAPDHLTCFVADIDRRHNTITWCNAGHCPPLLFPVDQPPCRLAPTAPLMGFFRAPWLTQTLPWTRGCRLFCYTDGFFEWPLPGAVCAQEASEEPMLGLEKFLDLACTLEAARLADASPVRFLERLDLALSCLANAAPVDESLDPETPAVALNLRPDSSADCATLPAPAFRDDCTALWVEAME
ncbi:MAG: fused response regulator/phosphatase [Desulfovibrio sp.]|nr:fused response regulator/phosphatase [Desulfovibrio sp.]